MVEATAAERDAYYGGYGESTSAEGLTMVSAARRQMMGIQYSPGDQSKPMDVDSMNQKSCHRCGRQNHLRADCRARTKVDGTEISGPPPADRKSGKKPDSRKKEGKRPGKCRNCNTAGHWARDCKKKPVTNNAIQEE